MPSRFTRTDGKEGPIDLSLLANDREAGYDYVTFSTASGLWYAFTALKTTRVEDRRVQPVLLKAHTEIIYSDDPIDLAMSPLYAGKALKNWLRERRHFPGIGEVSLSADVIAEGDRLTINGQQTSAVVSGMIREANGGPILANF
ncbi:MAG TPA: hypothetical protein VIH90_00710 [Candidatus Saccharimonadales bacterium]